MPIVVRPATEADAPAAQQVSNEAFATARSIYRPNPAAHANLAAIASKLDRLIAEEAGQIIATVRFGVLDSSLRIIGLAVLPKHRHRGVARCLIEELARIAAMRGCRTLSLFTVAQTGNVLIFEHLGFHVVSRQTDEYSISVSGEPLTEVFMEQRID